LILGLPFQAVPLLEWDGLQLAQSTAIANFVARQAAPLLLGMTLEEQAWSDMAVAYAQDIFVGIPPRYIKIMDGKKEEVQKEMVESWLPSIGKKIEAIFLKDGKSFVAGDKVE
jgi:glutathione S-transferase